MKNKTYPGLITADRLKDLHRGTVIRIRSPEGFGDFPIKSVGLTTLSYFDSDDFSTMPFDMLGIIPYPMGVWSSWITTIRDEEVGCVKVPGG